MMQFRTFTWPNEPHTLQISYCRKVVSDIDDSGNWFVQNLDTVGRVFEGEGVFHGSSCYAQFKLLATLLTDGVAGTLTLSNWDSAKALLTELEVTEQDCENFLRYRFRFIEIP